MTDVKSGVLLFFVVFRCHLGSLRAAWSLAFRPRSACAVQRTQGADTPRTLNNGPAVKVRGLVPRLPPGGERKGVLFTLERLFVFFFFFNLSAICCFPPLTETVWIK